MDLKTLQTLEYPKILERLAGYTAFAVSAEKARALMPVTDIEEARRLQAETSEAVRLLIPTTNLTIGGARDLRPMVELAVRGGVLSPGDLLDVKWTLAAARDLARTFERLREQYPHLSEIAARIPIVPGLVDAITRAISDHGEILDSASEKLAAIRRDLRIIHDRLLTKMQRYLGDPKTSPFLQEALITQRDGRYVLPLRAEFKGRIKAVVHDQSASGATLFVEPLAVVELNNRYRELQLAERDEERRVLAALSWEVADFSFELTQTVEAVAELDLAFARGKFAEDLRAIEPFLRPIHPRRENRHPGSVIRIYQARHPLLDSKTVVPIDVELDANTYAMVITGPNTGGKTVSLKTVGLLVLMAQSGLHIPAQAGSELSLFRAIYADIGDEQSIEQSLSTFSGHIKNIIRILDHADSQSLVILDELGAGTDPQEGAALARALLSHLLERGITTLVTTHHPELKVFAHATPGVINASVEFDLETLQPTFHLTVGLPGRSNALAIAQRLGLPEAVISSARTGLDPQDLHADDLLDEIHRQRDLSRRSWQTAESARLEAEHQRIELARRLEAIEDERHRILEQERVEADSRLNDLETELERLKGELARARQPLDAVKPIEFALEELRESIDLPVERRIADLPGVLPRRDIRLGDRVRLRDLNSQGVVTWLGDEEAEIQVGMLRVRACLSDLEALDHPVESDSKAAAPREVSTPKIHLPSSPGMELNLRGQRSDEALENLERYLDAAYLAGLPFVRIIHGKGTGKLRKEVRAALKGHPHVKSFESGGESEGGEGVTVASLQTG